MKHKLEEYRWLGANNTLWRKEGGRFISKLADDVMSYVLRTKKTLRRNSKMLDKSITATFQK